MNVEITTSDLPYSTKLTGFGSSPSWLWVSNADTYYTSTLVWERVAGSGKFDIVGVWRRPAPGELFYPDDRNLDYKMFSAAWGSLVYGLGMDGPQGGYSGRAERSGDGFYLVAVPRPGRARPFSAAVYLNMAST